MAPAPFALVVRSGNALRLAAVDAAAQRQGLTVGMALADARARCPALVSQPQDPAATPRALQALAAKMQRFTPMVALDPPDGLMLDITGCAHLCGTEGELAAQAMVEAGYTARHAFADHAAAARALVRYGGVEQDVRALPVTALELPADALSGLRRAGLVTLGDLARRPMAGLAARFGEDMVGRLRAILGEAGSPIAPRNAPAPIRAEARFAEPIARTEDVLAAIEGLLHDAARQMEARQIGGRRFAVMLERCDGMRLRLGVETGLPLRAPAPVMRLLQERIDSLADPLDPGFGFDRIALAVPRTEPLAARQIALTGDAHAHTDTSCVAALIDRLTTRLGAGNVLRLHPRDTHIPEASQHFAPASQGPPTVWPASSLLRPAVLLDPPQPITALAGVPDGPPQRFRWQGQLHEVTRAEGPERIAPEWWQDPAGHHSAGLTRDYYRVEDAGGQRFWVFRHGLFDERADPKWYLHGLFV